MLQHTTSHKGSGEKVVTDKYWISFNSFMDMWEHDVRWNRTYYKIHERMKVKCQDA